MVALVLLWLLLLAGPANGGEDVRFEQFSPQEEQMWQERIRRNPRDGRSYFFLGRFYDFVHRDQDAANAFKQATLLRPDWPQAFFNLGKLYHRLGRWQDAAVALRRATLLKSDYAAAYHFLGLVEINLGHYPEAAKALIKAYEANPGWAEKYYDGTSYGIHWEFGQKEVVLRLVQLIYPTNQRLARLLYNRWARGNAGMKEYWQEAAGAEKRSETGYQEPPLSGYPEPTLPGYQRGPDVGFQRGLEGRSSR
ncbi:MAG: tetratricopeptide repeat protein [Desulfobacca sp.]|uniref:tetratricopeptide repeat protein n=1 Tax=Desulfobacca sp. TaxID=2067990 RepID=UPI0040493BC3